MCIYVHMNTRLPRLLLPIVIGASAILTLTASTFGVEPAHAMTMVTVVVLAGTFWLERGAPFRRDWLERPGAETRADLTYVLLASLPDRAARVGTEVAVMSVLGLFGVAAAGERSFFDGLLRGLSAFVLADLGKYLIHRASHEGWLWRFHLAHHQPTRVDALNALRIHPVNMAYNATIDAFFAVTFAVPPAIAAAFATVRAVVALLSHANLDLDDQRQWVFSTPGHHRLHHAVELAQANSNYGSTLLVWDRLLGTLRRGAAPASVGVAQTGLPTSYLGQLVHPFCGSEACLARFGLR